MQRFYTLIERLITKYPRLTETKVDRLMEALTGVLKTHADRYEDQVAHSKNLTNKGIDRPEIEYAIEFFNKRVKDSLPPEDRDLSKWNIGELLHYLKGRPGYKPPKEGEEEEVDTPPVVYQKDNITIYDGSKEDRCVVYGKGERWCITKGSFANYRYDPNRKYPTFYLVKDSSLPSSDPKSFFVVMVGNDGTYKASDRTNNDLGGRRGQSEWNKWEDWSFVERHFPSVKGLESHFKYRKIPPQELITKGEYTMQDWLYSGDLNKKNQHLINSLRADHDGPFKKTGSYGRISWETFIRRILSQPEMKEVANLFVKSTYENPKIFLDNYEFFTPAQQKSIVANINNPQHPVGVTSTDLINRYDSELIGLQPIVDLLKAGKMKPDKQTHLYLTGRDNVVYIEQRADSLAVYVIDRSGKDEIKLGPKTEHYLLNDPYLSKINLQILTRTIKEKQLSSKILQKANVEGGDKDVIKIGDKDYIVQYGEDDVTVIATSGDDGAIPGEVGVKMAAEIGANEAKRLSLLKTIYNPRASGPRFNADGYYRILSSLSVEQRQFQDEDGETVYIDTAGLNNLLIIIAELTPDARKISMHARPFDRRGGLVINGSRGVIGNIPDNVLLQKLPTYFQEVFPPLTEQGVENIIRKMVGVFKIDGMVDQLRLTPNNQYKVIRAEDGVFLVNKTNKDLSKKISFQTGNVVSLRLSQANYDRLLGRETTGTPATPTAGAPAAPPAVSQGGGVNLQQVFAANSLSWGVLPGSLQRKLAQGGTLKNLRSDRGTNTRNELLRGRGRVEAAYQLAGTASALYIARLGSGAMIGIIASQPGNVHGFVTGTRFYSYGSAGDLTAELQRLNLNENNDMINKKQFLTKLLERVMKENQPAPSKPSPGVEPGIAEPGTEEKEEEDDPLRIPPGKDVDTKPKAGIEQKIINRAKNI